jgi:hypothetical protein
LEANVIEKNNDQPVQPPRPWSVEEMHVGNVLRRHPIGGHVVKRILTVDERRQADWLATEPHTRELLRELYRLGCDVAGDTDNGCVMLTGVGRANLTLFLVHTIDGETPVSVTRVFYGPISAPEIRGEKPPQRGHTALQAAAWLSRRAAR